MLNAAVSAEIIQTNPMHNIPAECKPKRPESTREFLTVEEVQALVSAPCKNESVKRAFLFSCFCGLRWSDVCALRWCDISCNGNHYHARITVKKTRRPLVVPLSEAALQQLPERGNAGDDDTVFTLPSLDAATRHLKAWAMPYVRHGVIVARGRLVHRQQAVGTLGGTHDPDLRQNHRPKARQYRRPA